MPVLIPGPLSGFPSVGKSSLMSGLTGTISIAADYEFTTLTTYVQLVPFAYADSRQGAGNDDCARRTDPDPRPARYHRGRQGRQGSWSTGHRRCVLPANDRALIRPVARTCNLVFIVLDVLKPLGDKAVCLTLLNDPTDRSQIIETELEGFGIRLNKQPPQITVRKKERGGIAISHTVPLTNIEPEEIRAVLAEYKISNADVQFRCDATLDEFIDVVEGGRIYMPALYVLNKIGESSPRSLRCYR